MSFYTLLVVVAAAAAGLVAIYSQKGAMLPGYATKDGRKGGWAMFAALFAGGIAGTWIIGRLAGSGNVFAQSSTALEFATRYEAPGSGLLMVAAYALLAGIVAVGAVAGFNTWRHGKAFM
jgi:hypothetical protein